MLKENNKIYRAVSVLENGHVVDGKLPIGSYVRTQWGNRKVVKNEVQVFDANQAEPRGV